MAERSPSAKLLGWKIDIKSEEEKRQEVEQQMQAMTAPAATPVEQVTELGESIIQKLVAAGITTVEALADMTPEQLEEIPGIGEKTLEKIGVAVRHYFGQYADDEERPEPKPEAETEPETEPGTGILNDDAGVNDLENLQVTAEEAAPEAFAAAEEAAEASGEADSMAEALATESEKGEAITERDETVS